MSTKCEQFANGVFPDVAEAAAVLLTAQSKYKDQFIGIRILGHFLCDFWKNRQNVSIGGVQPHRRLILEINSCNATLGATATPQEKADAYLRLSELGLWYRNHLMRVCEWVRFVRLLLLTARQSDRMAAHTDSISLRAPFSPVTGCRPERYS
jgi:hypothetical protein